MNAYLDERFPTLAAVSELVDGEEARIEALKKKRQLYREQQAAAARERRAELREQTARRIRAAIDRDSSPPSQFPARVATQIEEIRGLKVRQRVLELALESAAYLKDPGANAANLASVLARLAQLRGSDPLAQQFHAQIVQQWWQPLMDQRCAELRSVMTAAGWPRSNPPPESATVKEALKNCIDLELEGSEDMRTFGLLAEPLNERIAFNFKPGQDTVREDKPEWLFGYIFKLIDPHVQWLSRDLQTLVDMPIERLLRTLCPTFLKSLRSLYPLDAHFVSELLKFVSTVQTRLWVSRETVHSCIVSQIMDTSTLTAYAASDLEERRTGLRQVFDPQSGLHTIDFDADVPSAKPPFSAENSWQIVAQTIPFLELDPELVSRALQMPLIDHIYSFWEASLESFNKSHSSLARAVGGHEADRAVLPVMPDIEYLAQLLGAAAYIKANLETLESQLAIVESGWPIRNDISKFEELRNQAARKLANALGLEAQKHLRPYLQVEWREPEDHGHRLRVGIDALLPRVDFVDKLCSSSRSDRARVMAGFAKSLAEIVWRVIINANVFTSASAAELRADLTLLWTKLSLPTVATHTRNIAATYVLETGQLHEGIQPAEAEDLRRRRK